MNYCPYALDIKITYLIDVLISLDEVDRELSERRGGGISEGDGDTARSAPTSAWTRRSRLVGMDARMLMSRRRSLRERVRNML